ncbi:MAG: hypothetical protein AAF716_16635 [Cyanobacteria bacterium P01_D01_bin.1]
MSEFNPILSKTDIRGQSPFARRTVPEASTSLVFYKEGQDALVVMPGERAPMRSQLVFGKYSWLYVVDMSEFFWTIGCNLPSQTNSFNFKASARISCSVADPVTVARRNITNIRQVLDALIVDEMKVVSKQFEVDQSNLAEDPIKSHVKRAVRDVGFQIHQLTVDLSSESQIVDLLRKKEIYKRTEDVERTKIKEGSLTEKTSIETSTELERLRMEKDKAEMDRMKFKMDFYDMALKSGSLKMLAMRLAQDPGDIAVVAQLLCQQEQLAANNNINLLKIMLEEDALEGTQLGEEGKRIVQRLIGITETSTPVLEGDMTASTETIEDSSDSERGTNSNIEVDSATAVSELPSDEMPEEFGRV